ncbi:Zn(II)2Cys6 transcription factor [Aspergillus steynii IBT 23096]|uniref:Zn(II)2Cys6 transcription factor n=1 Tax=Aspergillus steynii IBT 23096 TaxID=1392250 RepID=A0A2I2G7S2_9EURO|nr:Zn(II)2Cys6 transcription factor [Aspergillus steynii IBT 23096]PLB48920.1 Zn(II)2Cys6 transcription factor [Aspergillus steynii IBT 23096]
MDSAKKNRNRAACRRCQRRKIRCDGQAPRCGSCQKANVPCISDGKQVVHRSYIASMEKRIKWLEMTLQESCPNVDLNEAPTRESARLDDSVMLDDEHEEPSILSPQQPHIVDEDCGAEEARAQSSISPVRPRRAAPLLESRQAHEVGLVSLSPGGEPRYIGPSSGYFFANLVFSNAGRQQQRRGIISDPAGSASGDPILLAAELLHTPASLPPRRESAEELSSKYFQTIHVSYPFLHQPSHMECVGQMYTSEQVSPIVAFQVYMVLAIAASDLSRRSKLRLPAEGYYTSAMQYFDQFCPDGSLAGLQSLLLLMIYALHNPSCGINIWNLNYQCLASLIDLGLQRDIRSTPSLRMSLFEQEMRTRVFWVVYTFDRTIGTMMGRPVGVRDEACDLRLPMDIADQDLTRGNVRERNPTESFSHISFGIHLFKVARLNSEIKYVMHSISREPPAYAYPPVRDIFTWQKEILEKLQSWRSEIPQSESSMSAKLCEAKYHEMMILVLRPSPAIPEPSEQSAVMCYRHAMALLESFRDLYKNDCLQYSRLVVHSIFLGTLVVLHSIWKLPDIAASIHIDELSANLTSSLNILSSIGEYWLEAQRARDCIEEISGVTMRRLLKTRCAPGAPTTPRLRPRARTNNENSRFSTSQAQASPETDGRAQHINYNPLETNPAGFVESELGLPGSLLEDPDSLQLFGDPALDGLFGMTGVPDFDGLMWEFFNTSQ